jgi:hypothetical protein
MSIGPPDAKSAGRQSRGINQEADGFELLSLASTGRGPR